MAGKGGFVKRGNENPYMRKGGQFPWMQDRKQVAASARSAVLRASRILETVAPTARKASSNERVISAEEKNRNRKNYLLAVKRRGAVGGIAAGDHPVDLKLIAICKNAVGLKGNTSVLYAWQDAIEQDAALRAWAEEKGITREIVVLRIKTLADAGRILKK